MKRLILAITAASLLSGTAAMAAPYQNYRNYDARRTIAHVDYRGHEFRRGERLPAEWRRGPALDWRANHLRRPPHNEYWVRDGNQFALVAGSNGVILDLVVR